MARTSESELLRERGVNKVLLVTLGLNLLVSFAKAGWGLVSHSGAMLADGIASLSDSNSNIIALVVLKFARKPADSTHRYGHNKFETFASAVIGSMLLVAAFEIGSRGVGTLVKYLQTGVVPEVSVTLVSFIVMFLTLIINIIVVTGEMKFGKKFQSEILVSDAKHTLTDVWVTCGVIVSLIFTKFGFPLADPIVSVFIAGVIVYTAFGIFRSVGTTLGDAVQIDVVEIRQKVLVFPGVRGCHNIRNRGMDSVVFMDLSIMVDPKLSVAKGHVIAGDLESYLRGEYPQLEDVVVHLEPDDEKQRKKSAAEYEAIMGSLPVKNK